jgi:hypothetical protein
MSDARAKKTVDVPLAFWFAQDARPKPIRPPGTEPPEDYATQRRGRANPQGT